MRRPPWITKSTTGPPPGATPETRRRRRDGRLRSPRPRRRSTPGSPRTTSTCSTRGATSGCTTSSAPTPPRWTARRDAFRRVGSERPLRQRLGDFNGWDAEAHPLAERGRSGIWEGFLPGVGRGAVYKFHIVSQFNDYRVDKADPFGFYHESPRGRPPWCGTSTTRGATPTGCASGAGATPSTRRCPSTRSTWVRGCGCPRRAAGRSPTASSRHAWPSTCRRRGSPTSSCCPSWSILSTARGATRRRATSPPPAGTAPPRTSCTSSTTCTSQRHRRHPGLGAVALPHRRARPGLLRRHAPVRARRHAQGVPPGLEELHLQLRPPRGAQLPDLERHVLARRLPRRRPAGGRRRLHALPGLLAAQPASGSPTTTAAARTWRPSTSCAASTRRSTSTSPTCRPSPRNPPPGPWSPGRPTWAGSGSGSSGTWAGCTTPCDYMAKDPIHRKFHHDQLTFRMLYAFTENFVLPLSHDEVVHGKGSLLGQDAGRRLAEVRQPPAAVRVHVRRSRARSCSSWGPSSASGASGTTTTASTGTCSSTPRTRAWSGWSRT